AEAFAREGAHVMVADVGDAAGIDAVSAISATGGDGRFVHADVTNPADVERMVAETEAAFGSLDILVNSAGILDPRDSSITSTAEEIWDRTMAVNLRGTFLCCRAAIPAMLRTGGGSVINVASFVALMGAATP